MARRRYPNMGNMDTRCTWPVTLKGDSHPISCFRLRKIGTLCRQHEAIRIRNLTKPGA